MGGEGAACNVADIVSHHACNIPEKPAIRIQDQSFTYSELDGMVWSAVAYLRKSGVISTDLVSLLIEDELLLLILLFAVARMGATAISLPDKSRSLNIVSADGFALDVSFCITDLLDSEVEGVSVIFVGFDVLNEFEDVDSSGRVASPKAPWLIIEGSGSTGRPKLMSITHGVQYKRMRNSLRWLPVCDTDSVASFVHLRYPVSKMLYLEAIYAGLTIVLLDKRPSELKAPVVSGGITILHTTLYHLSVLLRSSSEVLKKEIRALKALVVGGSYISAALRSEVLEKLTSKLFVRYGTIETDTATIAAMPEVLGLKNGVGRVVKGVTLQVVDATGEPLPPGENGSIRIKSDGMIDGYLGDVIGTDRSFKDGWFYPKDLGRFAEDGQLIHLGRADDLIILNGINIYPAEVESGLLCHPEVSGAAVVPYASKIFGKIPVALVVLEPGASVSSDELQEYCRERLQLRMPRRIVVVSDLPRNCQGKIEKIKCLDLLGDV